jgi:hypothetical protein
VSRTVEPNSIKTLPTVLGIGTQTSDPQFQQRVVDPHCSGVARTFRPQEQVTSMKDGMRVISDSVNGFRAR